MALNCKGQAAMMDAIYLLVIVASLSVVLFNFSSSYGNTVSNYLSSQYGVDFVTSALKTILYSSVPKDALQLEDSKEIDYLLAFLKQDYASSKTSSTGDYFLSLQAREVLRQSVKTAMSPMASRFDFAFFIQETQGSFNFVFIYLRLSTIEGKQIQAFKGGVAVLESVCPKGVKRFNANDSSPKDHREYYCIAKDEKNINKMLQNAGDVSRTFTGITLGELKGASIDTVSARVDLIMWLPTCIEIGNKEEPLWILDQETPLKPLINEFGDPSKPWFNNGEGKLICYEIKN